MKNKLIWWFSALLILAFSIITGWFFRFKNTRGYYPFPMVARIFYYGNKKIESTIIDKNFNFSKKDYSVSKVVTSPYPVPHQLILNLVDKEKEMENYWFKGVIKIDITRKGELIYSKTTKGAANFISSKGIYAFGLTTLPFPIDDGMYKDLRIKITVIKPDTELPEYVKSAEMILGVDLRL